MTKLAPPPAGARADHLAIGRFVEQGARLLDVGCGDGQLMELLQSTRGARTRGLEVEQAGVNRCVAKGLAVVQGDADNDLPVYPDDAFDVAVLSKTIQELARPQFVLRELARIAPRVIVSFRNYGHWRVRWTLLTTGKLPTLGHTPHWWADGARRPCTARDIADLASELGLNLAALTSVDDPGDRERVATKVEAGFASATRSIKDLDRGPDSLGTQRGLRVGSLRRLNWSAEELVAVLDRA